MGLSELVGRANLDFIPYLIPISSQMVMTSCYQVAATLGEYQMRGDGGLDIDVVDMLSILY